MASHETPGALEVFRLLGLETEQNRQRLRGLAQLGQQEAEGSQATYTYADTRNNTQREDGDAELEPAP